MSVHQYALFFGRYIGALKTVEKLKDTDLGEGMPNPKTISITAYSL